MTLFDATEAGTADALARAPSGRAGARPAAATWSAAVFAGVSACLVAAAGAAFARWQVARAVVPWDSKNHFYPMFRFLGEALRHGTLPLWNPYHFAGYPAVADPQSLIFTPTMAALAAAFPDAGMAAFDAMVLAHLVAGGIGVVGLGRHWRWHPAAALLASLVFTFGGSAASRLQHTGMVLSYSFFPLALWALLVALDRRSLSRAVVAGVLAALMLLGRDQVAYLLGLTLVALAGAAAFEAPRPLAWLAARAPVLAVAAAVAVTLVAVPALLTLQFLHDSNRPGIAYGMALEGSLDPANLLTFAAGNVFGSLDAVYDYWGPGAATPAGNDWTDRTIDYLFAGTVPAVLLFWHGLAAGRAWDRGARALLVILAVALLYAMGRHTPVFAAAFDWVPGVSFYRRPADATFIANIALALLCGTLLHRFVQTGRPRRPTLWTAVPLALGVASVVGAGLGYAWRGGHVGATSASLAGAAALAGVVALALRVGRPRGLVAVVLALATGAQLVWLNAASPLNAEPASTYSAYSGFYPDQARGLAVLMPELAARAAAGDHPRVEILGLDGSWQNVAMMLKVENSLGYNPLRIAAYERTVGVAESANDLTLRTFPDTFRGYNSRLARLLGLDYLVLDRPVAELPRQIPRPHGTLLFAGDHFFVYRLDNASAPRAIFAPRVRATDSPAEALDSGCGTSIGRADAALLADRSLIASPGEAPPVTTPVVISSYVDDAVTLDVDAPSAGVLVLHDLAYPGWEVRVDGVRKPLLHADVLFRGVEVAAGRHRVAFAYRPFSAENLTTAAADALPGSRR